jgi:hypothetical protein
MEKISWTNHVKNKEVLHRVKEERNILHTVQEMKANWTGHILHRNTFYNMLLKDRRKDRSDGKERKKKM